MFFVVLLLLLVMSSTRACILNYENEIKLWYEKWDRYFNKENVNYIEDIYNSYNFTFQSNVISNIGLPWYRRNVMKHSFQSVGGIQHEMNRIQFIRSNFVNPESYLLKILIDKDVCAMGINFRIQDNIYKLEGMEVLLFDHAKSERNVLSRYLVEYFKKKENEQYLDPVILNISSIVKRDCDHRFDANQFIYEGWIRDDKYESYFKSEYYHFKGNYGGDYLTMDYKKRSDYIINYRKALNGTSNIGSFNPVMSDTYQCIMFGIYSLEGYTGAYMNEIEEIYPGLHISETGIEFIDYGRVNETYWENVTGGREVFLDYDPEDLIDSPKKMFYSLGITLFLSLCFYYILHRFAHMILYHYNDIYSKLSEYKQIATCMNIIHLFIGWVILIILLVKWYSVLFGNYNEYPSYSTIQFGIIILITLVISPYLFDILIRAYRSRWELIVHHIFTILLVYIGIISLSSSFNTMNMNIFCILILYACLEPGLYLGLIVYNLKTRFEKQILFACTILTGVSKIALFTIVLYNWVVIYIQHKCIYPAIDKKIDFELKNGIESTNSIWCEVWTYTIFIFNIIFFMFGMRSCNILYNLRKK